MRTFILLLTLLSFTTFAADPVVMPADLPAEPVIVDLPTPAFTLLPDGSLAPGRSVHLTTGQPAPYPGWLPDAQEHTRREKINEKRDGKLKSYETGNVIVSTPLFITLILGVAGVFAGGAVAITKATEKKP